jgi:hypothetical protein
MKAHLLTPFLAAATILVAQPEFAKSTPAEEARIGRCIAAAARGQPWLERTLWGLRDQEAGWLGTEVANTNGTHDLGPLQINSSWVPRFAALLGRSQAEVRHWLRYDPCFNAEAARWIFLSALAQTRAFWKAVGVYHSPTPWRQSRYASRVATHMRVRFGPNPLGRPAS